jgi:hypothetical protein
MKFEKALEILTGFGFIPLENNERIFSDDKLEKSSSLF